MSAKAFPVETRRRAVERQIAALVGKRVFVLFRVDEVAAEFQFVLAQTLGDIIAIREGRVRIRPGKSVGAFAESAAVVPDVLRQMSGSLPL